MKRSRTDSGFSREMLGFPRAGGETDDKNKPLRQPTIRSDVIIRQDACIRVKPEFCSGNRCLLTSVITQCVRFPG